MIRQRQRRLPAQDWNRHKETIRRLYIEDDKPLEGEEGIIELMRQHGLSASKSQYETQFKKWAFRKNLKKEDWHIIFHALECSSETTMKSSVFLFGKPIPENKVRKETSRYRQCSDGCLLHILGYMKDLPDGIEIHQAAQERAATINDEEPTQELLGISIFDEQLSPTSPPTRIPFLDQTELASSSIGRDILPLQLLPPSDRNCDLASLIPSRLPTPSSMFEQDTIYILSEYNRQPQATYNFTGITNLMIPPNTVSLLGDIDSSWLRGFDFAYRDSWKSINPCVNRTMRLLPWKAQHDLQKSSMHMVIVKQIIYLLMNNFAGSDYADYDTLFEQVRQFSVSQMTTIFDAIPSPYSEALQQSILTIAIKSNVPQIVSILIDRGLDINNVTCRFAGRIYTPLSLACKFGRVKIVEILISAGVDVNQIPLVENPRTAIRELVDDPYLPDASCGYTDAAIQILQDLLVAGAYMPLACLEDGRFWKDKRVAESYLQLAQQPLKFKNGNDIMQPLAYVLNFCTTDVSTSAIKKMLGKYRAGDPAWDSSVARACMEAFGKVSYSGNEGLVKYFMSIGLKPDVRCICEAIRGNNTDIINYYIQNGANFDLLFDTEHLSYTTIGQDIEGYQVGGLDAMHPYAGVIPFEIEPLLDGEPFVQYAETTPLAEAIRWYRGDLIKLCESTGMSSATLDENRLVAAMLAAAEVGNINMVKMLLGHKSRPRWHHLTFPGMVIAVATLGNHEEIIEMLMCAGIQPDIRSLRAAVLVRNRRLFHLFLDSSCYHAEDDDRIVTSCVRWGDREMIQQLVDYGFRCTRPYERDSWDGVGTYPLPTNGLAPLSAAIRRGDDVIVQILIDNGAAFDQVSEYLDQSSPLLTAVQSGNKILVRKVLAGGVCINNAKAFVEAVSQSVEMTRILVDEFCRRYSDCENTIPCKALSQAIKEDSQETVRMLARITNLNFLDSSPEPFSTYGRSILGEVITTKNITLIRMILDSGGNAKSTVEIGVGGHGGRILALSQGIYTGDLAIVKLLHDAGADINAPATLGITRTPLQLAVEIGHNDIVVYLLDHGADINAEPCLWGGGTALQFAAMQGSVGIAEELILRGADMNAPGSRYQGKTAFEYAAQHGRMDMLLLLYHRGVDIVSDGGEQVRRGIQLAEDAGQLAAKSLVEQLANAKLATMSTF